MKNNHDKHCLKSGIKFVLKRNQQKHYYNKSRATNIMKVDLPLSQALRATCVATLYGKKWSTDTQFPAKIVAVRQPILQTEVKEVDSFVSILHKYNHKKINYVLGLADCL